MRQGINNKCELSKTFELLVAAKACAQAETLGHTRLRQTFGVCYLLLQVTRLSEKLRLVERQPSPAVGCPGWWPGQPNGDWQARVCIRAARL